MTQKILSDYLSEIDRIRAPRAGTGEISYYGALTGALNASGEQLKPRVFCVPNLRNRGAGFPDMGLFVVARGHAPDDWLEGQPPDRGVVEVDDIPEDLSVKLGSRQVGRYLAAYGLVLVTNYRDFVLLGRDSRGEPERRESFSFGCASAEAFFALARNPRQPKELAARFVEFLQRVLLYQAPLSRPEDLAFFLASYARDALARVDEHASLPAFAELRSALQEALGLRFEGPKGEHLFRSTLVQTLFYGLFSAWVEVAQNGEENFEWRAASWSLRVPFVDTLFQRIATPQYLKPLGLEEPLSWAAAALSRVDRRVFFARFQEQDAVRYFYEPFLAAFDSDLRKQLGVWYTPREIVRYMVERVDRVLRTELGIVDGLADPSVWVLDPCCGTGAYLVEVLDRIARTLREKGEDALTADDLKQAAMTRVVGFEIMPAPYVIAHWQVGHALRTTPFGTNERAAIYLTNSLTGWAAPNEQEPSDATQHGLRYTYPQLAAERAEAARVKQVRPILVVLGNPPYNAFAGTSPAEEAGLVNPYKDGLQHDWGIHKFNLDDLYIRFFRVAERRIAEETGRGVVCFISNHSWLWYPSYVVMRRRLVREFDSIWIDNLNGSRFETGKLTPDGKPDPSVFSTEANREGIQVGTAVALLVKNPQPGKQQTCYRDLWGRDKREQLLGSLDLPIEDFGWLYTHVEPTAPKRFSLRPLSVRIDYLSWPSLPQLAAQDPIPGLLEMRQEVLIDKDRDALANRMRRYFDVEVTLSALQADKCGPVHDMARFKAAKARTDLLEVEQFSEDSLQPYYQRPFEKSWCYYTSTRPIWNEPRQELSSLISNENPCLVSRAYRERPHEGPHIILTSALPDYHLLRPNCSAITFFQAGGGANLSGTARRWLSELGLADPDSHRDIAILPWHHALAIGYAPTWLAENTDGVRMDWPHVPLPNNPNLLRSSAALGARIASLLDPDTPIPGVTTGTIRPVLATVAVPTKRGRGAMSEADRALTAGWGHLGKEGAVMPGRGRIITREYECAEFSAQAEAALLGARTNDVFLNGDAWWSNVPTAVWTLTIGGYQVLKKWLSYREKPLLGRALTPSEVRYVRDMARRLAALRLMTPELDANYHACAAAHRPLE